MRTGNRSKSSIERVLAEEFPPPMEASVRVEVEEWI